MRMKLIISTLRFVAMNYSYPSTKINHVFKKLSIHKSDIITIFVYQ